MRTELKQFFINHKTACIATGAVAYLAICLACIYWFIKLTVIGLDHFSQYFEITSVTLHVFYWTAVVIGTIAPVVNKYIKDKPWYSIKFSYTVAMVMSTIGGTICWLGIYIWAVDTPTVLGMCLVALAMAVTMGLSAKPMWRSMQ